MRPRNPILFAAFRGPSTRPRETQNSVQIEWTPGWKTLQHPIAWGRLRGDPGAGFATENRPFCGAKCQRADENAGPRHRSRQWASPAMWGKLTCAGTQLNATPTQSENPVTKTQDRFDKLEFFSHLSNQATAAKFPFSGFGGIKNMARGFSCCLQSGVFKSNEASSLHAEWLVVARKRGRQFQRSELFKNSCHPVVWRIVIRTRLNRVQGQRFATTPTRDQTRHHACVDTS